MNKSNDHIKIIELYMETVGGDFYRCFYGTIRRENDAKANQVYGKVKVLNSFVSGMKSHQDELGSRLDDMVFIVLVSYKDPRIIKGVLVLSVLTYFNVFFHRLS